MNETEQRVENLFNAARLLTDLRQRSAFLDAACGADTELRHRLDGLFAAQAEAESFFERPAIGPSRNADSPGATFEVPPSGARARRPAEAGIPGGDAPPATEENQGPPDEDVGTVIGRYKLLQKIGEGGFGAVYMADQKDPVKRRVALKIIKLGMETRQVVARFEAERQALSLMEHPNIAKVFDAGATESGRPYFVMELVRGVPITQYCDENNLPPAERLQLFIEVCRAIQHAHLKGIIHRDIKPSNILVTLHDGAPVPKVINFGIAKATQQDLTEKTLFTQFHQFIGTPAYMSPEQAERSGVDINTRSDIYSLGVLLYELLTGKTPFDKGELLAAGLEEMRRTIREKEPVRPSARVSTMAEAERTNVANHRQSEAPKLIHLLRGDLDWIVMKALEKDRTRRYETANGLARDIQHHLRSEPVEARPPSPFYRLRKFAQRNKLTFAATTIILAVLVLGVIATTWQAVRATRAVREQKRLFNVANTATEHEAAQRERAEQSLYASDMRQAFQCLEKDELARALGLLNRHRPTSGDTTDRRGFEWRYLWQLCQGDPHDFLEGGEGKVWWLEFSPGGKYLAAGRNREVTIFDLASKSIVAHLEENTGIESRWGIPRWAVFTPDGKTLITARHDRVTFYETTHWTELPVQLPPAGGPIALSRDGSSLVTMPAADSFVPMKSFDKVATIWDLRTLRASRTLTNLDSPTVFSPDGKRLATDTPEGIKLWPLDPSAGPALLLEGSSSLLSHYSGYDSLRRTVAFSPDGRRIASGSSGANVLIRLWDATTGQRLDHGQLHGHREAITGLVFSPDSRFVASAGFDSTIQIWDVANLKVHRKLRGQLGSIWALAFAPDGGSLVSGGENGRDDSIKIWSFDGAPQPEEKDLNDRWQPVWISTNGEEVVTFGLGSAERWNTRTGQCLSVLSRPDAVVAIMAADGRFVYAANSNGVVYFGNFATGEIIARSGGHTMAVTAVAASLNGGTLVTAGRDARLCWWELPAAQAIRAHEVSGVITALEFSPDGKTLVSASEDLKLCWWDAASGRLLDSSVLPEPVFRLTFSPNGKLLATIGESRAWLWEVATRTHRPQSVIGNLPWNFSPDSTKFLTPAQLWNVSDGQLISRLEGHKTGVADSVFSPDGRTIATSAADVRLWDTVTQQELLVLAKPGMGVANLMFSADGSTLIAGDSAPGGGGLRIWRAPSFEDIEAKEKANRHNH